MVPPSGTICLLKNIKYGNESAKVHLLLGRNFSLLCASTEFWDHLGTLACGTILIKVKELFFLSENTSFSSKNGRSIIRSILAV